MFFLLFKIKLQLLIIIHPETIFYCDNYHISTEWNIFPTLKFRVKKKKYTMYIYKWNKNKNNFWPQTCRREINKI